MSYAKVAVGSGVDRRRFLKCGVAASSLGVSALALGAETPPTKPIRLGFIGLGGMGVNHLAWFLKQPDVRVASLCDVDAGHLSAAKDLVGDPGCQTHSDFREALGSGLDAVVISTPDHWHGLTAVAAARAGIDIYCEKPLTNSIGEGRVLADEVKTNRVVLQTGSHERSNPGAAIAKRLIEEGRLGRVHTVRVQLPVTEDHLQTVKNFRGTPPEMPVPEGFDYDLWLGHTPAVPYTEKRCHFWWRFNSNYGGGEMTDRGCHVIDLAHHVLGLDATGPLRVEATGRAPKPGLYDACLDFEFRLTYPDGLTMLGNNEGPRGAWFEGSEGKLFVAVHGARLTSEPASILEGVDQPKPVPRHAHRREFLDAIRSRGPVIAPAEAGHRTATVCHLSNLAVRLGEPFEWDPELERASNQKVNDQFFPTMRAPWRLDA